MALLPARHVREEATQMLVPLSATHAQLAALPVPVHQPAQPVTQVLEYQVELAHSVLPTNFQLEVLLLVLHAQLGLSQLLVPLLVIPVLLAAPLALQAQLVQLVTLALD